MRRAIILLALAGACSAPGTTTPSSWKLAARVALPSGAALTPDDPTKPGIPASQAVAYANGTVFAALANLVNYKPAGPSWLSIHNGQTLAPEAAIPLVSNDLRCTNA